MIEKIGNIFEEPSNAYVCTTNQIITKDGKLVMGAGIAKVFKERFPGIDREWGVLTRDHYHNVHCTKYNDIYLIAFPTKFHWKEKSDINLIINSCKEIVRITNYYNFSKVCMTRPGCGNGGLTWDYVKEKISDLLDDRFIVLNKGS